MPKPKQLYKFLQFKDNTIVSDYKPHPWVIGEDYSVTGRIKACGNGFHASEQPLDALRYVGGSVLAVCEGSGDEDRGDDKVAFRTMKLVKAYHWKKEDSVAFAIYAAEQVVKIYEEKYPSDKRQRDAIKAAKAYLKNPTEDNRAAARAAASDAARAADAAARDAYAAAYAADAAARAADAAARDAARAAYAAADAARAAYAAADAADAAYAAADAAADAADAAYAAADAEITAKLNRWLKARIKKLEEIK